MNRSLGRRAPTAAELSDLRREVSELAWNWTLKLSGQEMENAPFHLSDEHLTDDQRKAGHLARAAVLDALLEQVRYAIDNDVLLAMDRGATFADVGDALGVSRQSAGQRFRAIRSGKNVAVVISRRDRVHKYPNDPRGEVGEVGGPDQLASDQGIWPVGAVVRALAKYSIVAVDSTVRRVYLLDPEGWREVEPNKWEFTAVNGRELDPKEIEDAYASGSLPLRPGDHCPTRAGGAYRPLWF